MKPSSSLERPDEPGSLTYSVAEAAAALGVTPTTIYRLIHRRMLKPVPGLRHKRISKKQIHALAQGGDGHFSACEFRRPGLLIGPAGFPHPSSR